MIIFMIGYPLSGKSTIAKEVSKRTGCEYLGTGEYARSIGMGFEKSISERDFSEEFNDRIESKVWETIKNGNCIIDGYPRSIDQAIKILSLPKVRVIYCYSNTVQIADRLKTRSVEGRVEDTDEIVSSRIKASLELKKNIEGFLNIEMLDTSDNVSMRNFWGSI